MLRNLPEGATFTAITSAPDKSEGAGIPAEPDPEFEAMLDRKTWTEDRRLMAELINRINMLLRHSIQWQDGKVPDLPTVGPAEWRGEQTKKKPRTAQDVLAMFM